MPLRIVTRQDTGTLWITGTIRPAGAKQGYRVRKRAASDDPALAREEAASIEREIVRNHHLGHRPIERGFAAAVISYLEAESRSVGTKALVGRLLRHFGNIPLRTIDQDALDAARKALLKPDAAPGTVNRNLIVPMRAILQHAAFRGWSDPPQFRLLAEPEGRTEFLLPAQFEALHGAASERLRPLFRFLVCTGCRLGETLALDWLQVDLQAARVIVWADQAKAGRRRVVALVPAAVAALASLPHRDGIVFRSRLRGAGGGLLPYRASEDGGGGQIRKSLATACAGAGIEPIGAHVFRHTFASWHYALHRDLLALRNAGGWRSTELVERYAHLMPAGHEDGIRRVWGLGGPAVVVEKVA